MNTEPTVEANTAPVASEAMVSEPAKEKPAVDVVNPFEEAEKPEVKAEAKAEEQPEGEADYALKYPENTPKEVAEKYTSMFKDQGVEAEKAQGILNGLIKQEAEAQEQNIINLNKSLNDEANSLKEELGAKYAPKMQKMASYFKENGISPKDQTDLVSTWGFKKTFKFFEPYAEHNKETSASSTVSKGEIDKKSTPDYEAIFNSKEFNEKRKNQHPEANNLIRQFARERAALDT